MIYKPQYFSIRELICPHAVEKFGEFAWSFLDDRAVMLLDIIRRKIDKPITVNNYETGGEFSQRGFRCNQCQLVRDKTSAGIVYCSPHLRGIAFDFDVAGMHAEEVRQWLIAHKDLLPMPIRLEKDVNWVHLDIAPVITLKKITMINP